MGKQIEGFVREASGTGLNKGAPKMQKMRKFNRIESASRLRQWYWSKLLSSIANSVSLKDGETVVDFGAGEQLLKGFLPKGVKYVSCEIDKSLESDIRSLSEIRHADVVFASNVFEHLTEQELLAQAKLICGLNPRAVVVAIPRETSWLNKTLRLFAGLTFEHGWEHRLGWKQIMQSLSSYFFPVKVKNFYLMQWIVVLKRRK